MYHSNNDFKYKLMLQNSISLCINTLSGIRTNYTNDIDLAIRAVDQLQKYLPDLKRALVYYKNKLGDYNGPREPPSGAV